MGVVFQAFASLVVIFFVSLGNAAEAGSTTYLLDSNVKNANAVEFIKYGGPGQWDNYLAMNIPFEPIADLFRQLLIKERIQLTNRGEAHITVVTPVEYWNTLRPVGVTISEIDKIAENLSVQASQFDVVCLGQGNAILEGKVEKTFFVVVASENLTKIREQIQNLFVTKGGKTSDFIPSNYYPHITLGFTKRDLHESDGVIKDSGACASELKLTDL